MIVDSHCHLDFPDFDGEHDALFERARQAGVGLMVSICTRVRHVAPIRALAEKYPSVYFSVGTHPHRALEEDGILAEEIITLSTHDKCVAIGEAGLDYFYDKAPRECQMRGLRVHIEAARHTGLPLVIHARDADEDMADVLRKESAIGAFPFLLHCFSSGTALAHTGVELGGYISFSGILTFKRSDELRQIAASVPHDRLLVETDAPYLAPQSRRGKRNEPAYTVETASVLAQSIGVSEAEVSCLTTNNFFRLFSKVPKTLNPYGA